MGLPAESPNLNAHAEQFVRSIKEECLDRVVPLGERHRRAIVGEFMIHYHEEQDHQGLWNRLIDLRPESEAMAGPVNRCDRVGGVLNYFYRVAA